MTDKKSTKSPSKGTTPKVAAQKTAVEHAKKVVEKEAAKVNAPAPILSVKNGNDPTVTIVETAPPETFTYALDQPATLIPLIRASWNRAKGKGDASFDECAPEFRGTLLAHAIGVLKTSAVLQGDTCLARFELEVARIKATNPSTVL